MFTNVINRSLVPFGDACNRFKMFPLCIYELVLFFQGNGTYVAEFDIPAVGWLAFFIQVGETESLSYDDSAQ